MLITHRTYTFQCIQITLEYENKLHRTITENTIYSNIFNKHIHRIILTVYLVKNKVVGIWDSDVVLFDMIVFLLAIMKSYF